MIDPGLLNHFSEWQGVGLPHEGLDPMIVEPPQDEASINDQMSHTSIILATKELIEEQKHTSIEDISMEIINFLLSKIM